MNGLDVSKLEVLPSPPPETPIVSGGPPVKAERKSALKRKERGPDSRSTIACSASPALQGAKELRRAARARACGSPGKGTTPWAFSVSVLCEKHVDVLRHTTGHAREIRRHAEHALRRTQGNRS